jgi:hypothetical protein
MKDLSGELTAILITVWWLQKLRDRLAVSTKATHMFDVDKFNMRRLYELQVRK